MITIIPDWDNIVVGNVYQTTSPDFEEADTALARMGDQYVEERRSAVE